MIAARAWFASAGGALLIVGAAGCTGATSNSPWPGPLPSHPRSINAATGPTLASQSAWAEKCLPKKASNRLGPATEYLGLPLRVAIRVAKHRHAALFPIGVAGRCTRTGYSDLVYYRNAIDIAIDQRSMDGRVILAERVNPDSVRGIPVTGH